MTAVPSCDIRLLPRLCATQTRRLSAGPHARTGFYISASLIFIGENPCRVWRAPASVPPVRVAPSSELPNLRAPPTLHWPGCRCGPRMVCRARAGDGAAALRGGAGACRNSVWVRTSVSRSNLPNSSLQQQAALTWIGCHVRCPLQPLPNSVSRM
eukprot:357907-Chlamydomonas_euryale.AAC.3